MAKTDNGNLRAKLTLRRHFLDTYYGKKASFTVIDCCAGSGMIWNPLRSEYACRYFGIDMKKKTGRLSADSARILQAGAVADVIDIDTYESPWDHYFNLLPNLKTGHCVFLTIGSVMLGQQQKSALEYTGLSKLQSMPSSLPGKISEIITSICLARCCDYGITIKEGKRGRYGNAEYIGLRLEKETP